MGLKNIRLKNMNGLQNIITSETLTKNLDIFFTPISTPVATSFDVRDIFLFDA